MSTLGSNPRAAILHGAAAALRANAADLRRFLLVPDGRSFDALFIAVLADALDRIAELPAAEQHVPLAALDGTAIADMRAFLAEPRTSIGHAPAGTEFTASDRERADVRAVLAMIEAAMRYH